MQCRHVERQFREVQSANKTRYACSNLGRHPLKKGYGAPHYEHSVLF